MEKMLVIVFDDETKAYEGSRALAELDQEGSIAIYAESVIQKRKDGSVDLKETEAEFPVGVIGGTAIGSLIGLLGGPIGLGLGAAFGATAGAIGDLYTAGVDEDFLADVAAQLTPGKFAVLADISEEWVTPLDTKMEKIGGVVIRTAKQHFEEERRAREIAAIRADIAQLKAEQAHVRAERKAEIQARIDHLNHKLEKKLDDAKKRSEQIKQETDAKLKALHKRAVGTRNAAKEAINQRITEIRQDYEHADSTLRHATATQLRKAAAKLEKAG